VNGAFWNASQDAAAGEPATTAHWSRNAATGRAELSLSFLRAQDSEFEEEQSRIAFFVPGAAAPGTYVLDQDATPRVNASKSSQILLQGLEPLWCRQN